MELKNKIEIDLILSILSSYNYSYSCEENSMLGKLKWSFTMMGSINEIEVNVVNYEAARAITDLLERVYKADIDKLDMDIVMPLKKSLLFDKKLKSI